MGILVITTGGTIGASPYEDTRNAPSISLFPKNRDYVQEAFLQNPLNRFSIHYVPLEARDSKHIDAAYRKKLGDIISEATEDKILVTHGTDALLATGEFLYERMQTEKNLQAKRIVLTGAMIPLANGAESDGFQNLDAALSRLEGGEVPVGLSIVLSDYVDGDTGTWKPHFYEFAPGIYEKSYAVDSRFSRIQYRT